MTRTIEYIPAWMRVLAKVDNNSTTDINHRIGGTYTHTKKLLDELKANGYITQTKHGRCVKNVLTKKGLQYVEHILNIL